MIIKLKSISDDMLGSYDAKLITGTRIDNGEEWEKKFFANDQKLMDELSEFGVGETINVRLTKGKGPRQWNISAFEAASDDLIASVRGGAKANPTQSESGASGYQKSAKQSTWNGRTGEAYDRSAAVYLAWDIIKETTTPAQLKKVKLTDLFAKANKINDYIHDGDDGLDPLDPPAID